MKESYSEGVATHTGPESCGILREDTRTHLSSLRAHTDATGVPLGAGEDPTVFKLFHLDVGLVGTATGMGAISPIEVKSGASGSLRSLHQLMLKHDRGTAIRLDVNPPSRQDIDVAVRAESGMKTARYHLLNLPLYMVERVREIA